MKTLNNCQCKEGIYSVECNQSIQGFERVVQDKANNIISYASIQGSTEIIGNRIKECIKNLPHAFNYNYDK